MNYCNKAKLMSVKKVDCNTWCCEKDKCNVPEKPNITVTTVSRSKALPCYQIVGSKQESVRCMFADSYCMYTEYGPKYSYLSSQKKSASQLCSTKSQCDETKAACDLLKTYSSYSYTYLSYSSNTCSVKCCNTAHCNSLPWNYRYEEEESGPKKNTKTKPNWINSETYATPNKAAWDHWVDDDQGDDSESYNSGYNTGYNNGVFGMPVKYSRTFWTIMIVIVAAFISGGVAAAKRSCKNRSTNGRYYPAVKFSGQESHAVGYPKGRQV